MFITHGPRSSRSVCLTFDDGPHPELTPKVLDALAAVDAKATFFVVGRMAQRFPDIVKRIEAEGHCIGHHSYSHPNPTSTPSRVMRQEARQATRTLSAILGHGPRFYRPPHGKLHGPDFVDTWALRQTIVLWNVDPKDFAQPSSQHVVDWFKSNPLRGGDLLLLHDTTPHTFQAVPDIVAEARRAGLEIGRLDHWTRWSGMMTE
jgi:peptidoglycan/xylan/chitin deacetylase (PgdA/CDA1 family)